MNKILSDINHVNKPNKKEIEKNEKKIQSNKKYLTIKEAAELIGVTPLTLRNWDNSKKLIAHRNHLNNYRIYKENDIKIFLRKIESKGKIQLG